MAENESNSPLPNNNQTSQSKPAQTVSPDQKLVPRNPGNQWSAPPSGTIQKNFSMPAYPITPAPLQNNREEKAHDRIAPVLPKPQDIAPRQERELTNPSPILPRVNETPTLQRLEQKSQATIQNERPDRFREVLGEAEKGEIFKQLEKIAVPKTSPPPTNLPGAVLKSAFQEKPFPKEPLFKTFSQDTTEKIGKVWNEKGEKKFELPRAAISEPAVQKNALSSFRYQQETPRKMFEEEGKKKTSKLGPIIGIIIVIFLLIVAGLYSLGKKVSERMDQEEKAIHKVIPNPAIFGSSTRP